ncbi:hypothetical protein M0N77_12925 [Psychrobacter sp. AH5]|uniref:hypothetical protein n=1 Tax=Psychrobacter sp. AH5 TaxID=2937433 RepID=UPI00333ED0B2
MKKILTAVLLSSLPVFASANWDYKTKPVGDSGYLSNIGTTVSDADSYVMAVSKLANIDDSYGVEFKFPAKAKLFRCITSFCKLTVTPKGKKPVEFTITGRREETNIYDVTDSIQAQKLANILAKNKVVTIKTSIKGADKTVKYTQEPILDLKKLK